MRFAQGVGIAVLVALIVVSLSQQEPVDSVAENTPMVRTLSDSRSGTFVFRSYSLGRDDVVRDKLKRRPAAVSAKLKFPVSKSKVTKVPAAVLLHGSDGLTELQAHYARKLRERGVATLVVDSFSGRGIRSTVGRQASLAADAMVVDAYVALSLLATHPRIDRESIAVIGWSKGGVAALWSARTSFHRRLARSDHRFAAHVAFYPWCGEQEATIALTGAPILILSGELDDWSGTRPCSQYVEQARTSGFDARIVVYDNAHHGFDNEGSFHTFLPNAVDWSECAYVARETGFVIRNSGWFAAWPDLQNYLRQCSTPGVHVASNSRAKERVTGDLFRFLTDVFAYKG